MIEVFKREASRTFVVAPDFAAIVAVCAEGERLKKTFRAETEAGKIVIVLTADEAKAQLNYNKIALADELLILLEAANGNYSDFEAAMYLAAKSLDKHIRVIERGK